MRRGEPEDVIDFLKPGARIYVQGGPGECQSLIELMKARPRAFADVEIWSCLIPGVNRFDYASLPEGPRLVTFMASPSLARSIATGRTRIEATPYSQIGARLAQTPFDLAIVHVSPPDDRGVCSYGIACDAPGLVAPNASRRIAFINKQMPRIAKSEGVRLNAIDLGVVIDQPLLSPPERGERSLVLEAIGEIAAGLVPNGAVIQSGIGEAPGAVIAALRGHRGLRAHSGIITPDYRILAESGALDPDAEHLAGVAWGPQDFYDWLGRSQRFAFGSMRETHSVDRIARLDGFVSIGSALEVDLSGALNLEWRGKDQISSIGGAPDFMAGARRSFKGRSIIVLPSRTSAGASRIVPRLARPASIAPDMTDLIVTEFGVADIRGLAGLERARALAAIAAPEHRDRLLRAL